MIINVAEELGTRYVIASYAAAFRRVIDNHPNDTLDIGSCRLGLQAAQIIREYYGTRTFINSEDSELNGYLEENMRRARVPKLERKIKLYPATYDVRDVHDYIKSLSTEVVYEYRIDTRKATRVQMAFLTLLIITRPEIVLDAGYGYNSLCDFIRDSWLLKAEQHKAYYEVDGANLIVRKVVDGYVSVPYRNEVSEEMYVSTFKCFPYEFGNEYLYETPEWAGVVDSCLRTLNTRRYNVRTIEDFITTR